MVGLTLRLLIAAIGLWVAASLVSGIQVESGWTLFGAALLLGLVNALVRPVLVVLTLPISILTLGLFLLVINAAMLGLVAALLDGFKIQGFWSALGGSIVISLVSWVASWFVGPRGRFEAIMIKMRH